MKTKLTGRTARAAFLFLAIIISPALDCGMSMAGVTSLKAAAVVREEYDDNIFLTKENRTFDWITRAVPTVDLAYSNPWWELTLKDTFNAWYYARLDKAYWSNSLDLKSKMAVVKNFAYLDVTDTYENVVLEPRRSSTNVNFNVNRTDTNVLNASPYLKFNLDPASYLKAGYTYTNIWYKSEGTNRQQHKGYLSLDHKFTPVFEGNVGGEYVADRPETPGVNAIPQAGMHNDQEAAYAGIIYNITEGIKFDGSAGYRWFRFKSDGRHDRTIYNAGLTFGMTGPARLELRGSSDFGTTALNGVVDTRKQDINFQYNFVSSASSIKAGVFHKEDDYVQIVRTDETVGAKLAMAYAPGPRTSLRVGGAYQHDEFQPDGRRRNLYTGSAGVEYKLTPKIALSLAYEYNRSTGILEDDFFDNHAAVQISAEL